jgi:DNA-3-methyladenine glycosylase I
MCNSNVKSAGVAQIDGRPVLQPAGNRVAAARQGARALKKSFSMPASYDNAAPMRPTPENAARAAAAYYPRPPTPASSGATRATTKAAEKSRATTKASRKPGAVLPVVTFAALDAFEPTAGSIAAAQREHAALAQAQRKQRIAHYGRAASFSRVDGRVCAAATAAEPLAASPTGRDEKRCSFITPYSGN